MAENDKKWQKIRGDGTIMIILSKIFSSVPAFSLFLGLLLLLSIPSPAEAGFISSLFGDEAYAQTDAADSVQSNKDLKQNSQTMTLLQANVSSASILQEKNTKNGKQKDNQVNEKVNVNVLSDNALLPATGPLGVSDGKDIADSASEETSIYVVRKGDTLSAIANMFGVSINTILIANDMKKNDKLSEGDVLFILPISGLEHTVVKGQTLQSLAKLYKVDVSDIALYNGIAQDSKLAVGD